MTTWLAVLVQRERERPAACSRALVIQHSFSPSLRACMHFQVAAMHAKLLSLRIPTCVAYDILLPVVADREEALILPGTLCSVLHAPRSDLTSMTRFTAFLRSDEALAWPKKRVSCFSDLT
jgi:hypothetical protein